MTAIKLHVIKPSVNNMTARVFLRAARLDFVEDDVYGKTRSPEFAARNPSFLTPMVETDGLPKGVLWESCAIMQYLCNKHGLTSYYPSEPAARAMVDSAMFYVIGTLYPYIARATYPVLGFPQYAGEVGASDAGAEAKAAAQKAATEAVAGPLEVFHSFYLSGRPFIGGDHVSIADIRLAASLEFLAAVDYAFPGWASDYRRRVESTLGAAYSEPAADVRGYIDWVRSQKKGG
jgi:glutathione S-transferase